jgi:hypothetical protein
MSATFTPYLEAQAHRDPTDSGAYIRVRVPNGPRPDRSILVYLPASAISCAAGSSVCMIMGSSGWVTTQRPSR